MIWTTGPLRPARHGFEKVQKFGGVFAGLAHASVKPIMKSAARLVVLAFMLCVAMRAMPANVPQSGYTNDFGSQPPAVDWATFNVAGAAANTYDLDTDVNAAITAAGVSAQTTLDMGNPPVQLATATWSSTGFYLQIRPTGNRYTVLMGKFVNDTGTNATEIAISYLFTIAGAANAEEAGKGTRVYYSLTGATNSWTNLGALNTTAAAGASVSTNVAVDWPHGANLYLLWADDNANPGTDTGYQVDNFSLQVTAGAPLSTALIATLDAPTNNAVVVSGGSVTATAIPSRGTAPYTIEYFTNSGLGNTVFTS